jgi:hypothetical protein
MMLMLAAWLSPSVVSAQSPQQASARLAAAQALLAADTQGTAFRTDASVERGELVLRFTPTDRAAELRRTPTPARHALEARARFGADGALDAMTVRGGLAARPRVRVPPSASDEERTAAAAALRYHPATAAEVRQLARTRAAALGDQPAASGETFRWRPADDGSGLQPVWVVQLMATRARTAVPYVLTLDAADGGLIEIRRGTGQ